VPDARVRVLVVEDHPVNQQTIALQLETLGYLPRIVGDGLAALQVLEHEAPVGIVLLDCHLPGIDGYEVARRIRQLEARDGREPLSILAISAAVGETHYRRCLDSGMDGVLGKPLRLDELANLLELWMPLGEPSNPSPLCRIEPAPPETLFVAACLDDLQQLREALARDDLGLVRHHVHRLHGAALTVGAAELAELGKALETAMDAEGLSKQQWSKALEQVDSALERYTQAAT
jgi:two-component system sensor histidine kinase EvgS